MNNDCANCEGRCCRYVALQLDRPRAKRDYDHIRWFLLHERVSVFIDGRGRWFVEFRTPCRALRSDHRCGRYAERPRICREHNAAGGACELHEPEPYRACFTDVRRFEDFLDGRGIDWRFKQTGRAAPPGAAARETP